jgi:hypothetical protein
VTERPHGFTLRVPPSWFEFDVWRATRTGDLSRLIDSAIEAHPELAPQRRTLIRLLKEVAGDAERRGAVFCAAMLDPVGDEDMLVATVMAFHTSGALDPEGNTADEIASQITAIAPDDGSSAWRRVETVDLPAGRAVSLQGVEQVDLGVRGREPVDCVVRQTLVPIPDGQGVLNVVCTSPQVQLAEPMLDLFDAITKTLTWLPSQGGGASPN